MRVEKKFELAVEGKLENLPRISEFIDETMRQCNIESLKDIYAVQLSVDEACTNIIEHAYAGKSGGAIVIRCMLSGEKFIVNIIDSGKAFDPTSIPNPNTDGSLNERKEGGLGIFFIKKFMDEIKYVRSDDKNLLIIAKHIKN
jgi:serine/threonine-protein kinase RsbW